MGRRTDDQLVGMLFIGDPHIEGRCPDFRRDDYPNVILDKVQWLLNYAAEQSLLPVFLGDMFDKPRDNPIWVICRLIEMLLGSGAIGIYGNHDCAEPTLTENDSLSLLIKSGCLRLVSDQHPWRGTINGRSTLIGGSSYREEIPRSISLNRFRRDSLFADDCFGVWVSHHDVLSNGYESGRFKPFPIENIDVLVNGHIHTRGTDLKKGKTTWMTPGNISRRSRSEKNRSKQPAALVITPSPDGFSSHYVTVPHGSFEDVFYEPVCEQQIEDGASAFVAGLSELRHRRTSSGAGLKSFLNKNLEQFSDEVASEIKSLAKSVTEEQL